MPPPPRNNGDRDADALARLPPSPARLLAGQFGGASFHAPPWFSYGNHQRSAAGRSSLLLHHKAPAEEDDSSFHPSHGVEPLTPPETLAQIRQRQLKEGVGHGEAARATSSVHTNRCPSKGASLLGLANYVDEEEDDHGERGGTRTAGPARRKRRRTRGGL